jgi:hypothetical protein
MHWLAVSWKFLHVDMYLLAPNVAATHFYFRCLSLFKSSILRSSAKFIILSSYICFILRNFD